MKKPLFNEIERQIMHEDKSLLVGSSVSLTANGYGYAHVILTT